ncbi:MAG: hypothetical protein CL605_09490 [Altibacter sp.]|uniref:hypothetical protein n=1 Tax=Altibacter sp. TaxID=2024823 RepID=UPI000C93CDE7|nr:hypothetical protein [Altibacter sp.]MAP55122.1 hypothetical protein [Altibacter sp.]|tara:strand:+ start:1432 stop:2232 length:801 start_codon:yes stop_codon:yes gene_type:complete
MSYKNEIEKFVINGYKNTNSNLVTAKHNFVLKNKEENFITTPKNDFKYHTWASSLKSSQAYAYNIFSGIKNPTLEFEFSMEVFERAAQIDVKLEDLSSNTIELFEVKAFEICYIGLNKIQFENKYFNKGQYRRVDIADQFIRFLQTVIGNFKNQRIYGSGIKQLCSHLLGIINTIDKPIFQNKKFKLYSFCLDTEFTSKFIENLDNYKSALGSFKIIVAEFLKEIELDSRIEYCGYLSARDYINKNREIIGKDNYNYVVKRYITHN